MTRQDALIELQKLGGLGKDVEVNHSRADDILCELLKYMGLPDIVEAFEAVEKWYA